MRESADKDFWSHVDKTSGCWVWKQSKTTRGYGRFRRGSKYVYAHRVAYELAYGPIPEGMCICHHCDNPPCCNPDHLFAGTMADNMRDRDAKGRNGSYKNRGKPHPGAAQKRTPEQRAAQSARTTALFADPERRQRMSEKSKAYFANPTNRQRQSEALKAFHANKKKSETR